MKKKVDEQKILQVLILKEKGYNHLQIAKKLEISRTSVYKYLNVLSEFEKEKELTISDERMAEIKDNTRKIATILETENRDKYGKKMEGKADDRN